MILERLTERQMRWMSVSSVAVSLDTTGFFHPMEANWI